MDLRNLTTLATASLTLRPFTASDGGKLYSLYGDPDVMDIRKIGTQNRAESDAQLLEIVDHWDRRAFGLWAVVGRSNGDFLGECGLREIAPGSDKIELSYGLRPEFWGRGYATEASLASLDFGFANLQLGVIYGLAKKINQASLHVLGKLGFSPDPAYESETVARLMLTRCEWFRSPNR